MKLIPVNDLKRELHTDLGGKVRDAVIRVADSGWYVTGPELEKFESEFAAYCGVAFCAGVANGTDAIELALRALELPTGAQVATVANAGGYSTTAILRAGLRPLYIDVDESSMTMDPISLRAQLNDGCRAVIVTHLYGRMAPIEAILREVNGPGLPVIEDCAQAHGAELSQKKAGAWGTMGCFSFYPTKNLGAMGDAGAVVTSDAPLARRLRELRQYGWTSRYKADVAGGRNSRMDEMQAAVLRVKLTALDIQNERRREIAAAYSAAFAGTGLALPPAFGRDYVGHLYIVRSAVRDALRTRLGESGVGTDIHYPIPDHRQRSSADTTASLPVTERCAATLLTLPCFPALTDAEVDAVIQAVLTACGERTAAEIAP